MKQEKSNLNLARKWRPQSFKNIVGQDIPIKMLQNSLYLKKYFPVYLFAGQRGCGKTSSARVFAAAINCQKLPDFQTKPVENPVPCQACDSCLSMARANHPDFIEIDAASHTGVDNVRQIIEAAAYVPLSGQKKIYLIDEAHMLSKAAFNAFLKILEEPPSTVLFILATTELKKIPETVLSRCFHVSFTSVEQKNLLPHLKSVCASENIEIDDSALEILIEETDGSVRDALNLLEQVRFSSEQVTQDAVLNVLGKISNTAIIKLFACVLEQDGTKLLTHLHTIAFKTLVPQTIWNMIVELCRALMWVKYGVQTLPNSFNKQFDELFTLANNCSLNRLHAIMQLLWSQEALFLQTSKKHTFLEVVLLQLCQQTNIADVQALIQEWQKFATHTQGHAQEHTQGHAHGLAHGYTQANRQVQNTGQAPVRAPEQARPAQTQNNPQAPTQTQEPSSSPTQNQAQTRTQAPTQEITNDNTHTNTPQNIAPDISNSKTQNISNSKPWQKFVQQVTQTSNDHLLNSIFVQAYFLGLDDTNGVITIQLSSDSDFFKDKLNESKNLWEKPIREYFPEFTKFAFKKPPKEQSSSAHNSQSSQKSPERPTAQANTPPPQNTSAQNMSPTSRPSPQQKTPTQASYQKNWGNPNRKYQAKSATKGPILENIDVSDTQKWPLANLIIRYFPGKIKRVKEPVTN